VTGNRQQTPRHLIPVVRRRRQSIYSIVKTPTEWKSSWWRI